jgi:VanZ family protein
MTASPPTARAVAVYWLPVAAYCALLWFASAQPGDATPPLGNFDKLVHFIAYAGLGALAARGFRHGGPGLGARAAFVAGAALAAAYGASDELHQYFVPGRFASVWDWVADAAGALAAAAAYAWAPGRGGATGGTA